MMAMGSCPEALILYQPPHERQFIVMYSCSQCTVVHNATHVFYDFSKLSHIPNAS